MSEYDFVLKFALPGNEADPEDFLAVLENAGLDDAVIGLGKKGRIAFDFSREAASSDEAVISALNAVKAAIPGALFIEAEPDLVGFTDVAELAGCSRQNIRKISASDRRFPIAVHDGNPELFHLADVLVWMNDADRKPIDPVALEVAATNRQVNLAKQLAVLPGKQLAPHIAQACEA